VYSNYLLKSDSIRIRKNVKPGEYKLDDIFKGLENSWIAKNVLKNEFEEIRKT